MDPKKLKALISEIVRNEIRAVLPGLVSEYIQEQVFKAVVTEQASHCDASVRETRTTVQSVKPPTQMKKHADKMFENVIKNSPFKDLYDDVEPINPFDKAIAVPQSQRLDEDVSIEDFGIDVSKMKSMAAIASKPQQSLDMSTPDMKIRELEARRKALDVPAVVSR